MGCRPILAGDVQATLGNWQAAAAAYQKAANLDFSEATALRFARALANVGDGPGAARVIGLYLSQNPQSIPVRRLHADLHMASGRWQSALADLEIIRARAGNRDAALLNNLAWVSINAGENAQALRYARAAYWLMPDNPAVAGTLGWALHRTGADRDGALAMLEKAVLVAPLDPALRFQLAQAYAAAGRIADARKSVSNALQSNHFADRQAALTFLTRL
jgi:tetratricopeptide (TPR) repeat protein